VGVVAVLAALSITVGLTTLFGRTPAVDPLAAAVALAVGGVGLESVASVALPADLRAHPGTRRILTVALTVLAAFWGFAVYAQRTGEVLATAWGEHLSLRPKVVVFSRTDLRLSGPGVSVETGQDGDGYTYRYAGYRLLVYSHGRWFLLPEGWTADGSAAAVVLPVGPGLRMEVAPRDTS
jgi:hypothetical protein